MVERDCCKDRFRSTKLKALEKISYEEQFIYLYKLTTQIT